MKNEFFNKRRIHWSYQAIGDCSYGKLLCYVTLCRITSVSAHFSNLPIGNFFFTQISSMFHSLVASHCLLIAAAPPVKKIIGAIMIAMSSFFSESRRSGCCPRKFVRLPLRSYIDHNKDVILLRERGGHETVFIIYKFGSRLIVFLSAPSMIDPLQMKFDSTSPEALNQPPFHLLYLRR